MEIEQKVILKSDQVTLSSNLFTSIINPYNFVLSWNFITHSLASSFISSEMEIPIHWNERGLSK